jgi:hypothetical protein
MGEIIGAPAVKGKIIHLKEGRWGVYDIDLGRV